MREHNKKLITLVFVIIICTFIIIPESAAYTASSVTSGTSYLAIPADEYYPENYTGYEYPIRPGSPEWAELENHQEMVDACQIPEDELSCMSTEALAQTVLAYPLIADIFAYDNYETGIDIVKTHFNGLSELNTRSDKKIHLSELMSESASGLEENATSKGICEIGNFETYDQLFDAMVLAALVSQTPDNISEQIQPDSANAANAVTNTLVGYLPYPTSYTYVHNNTVLVYNNVAIEVWSDSNGNLYYGTTVSDIPSSYKTTMNNEYQVIYGITPTANPTVKYNCHSYAWYSQSTSNSYWMDDPSLYLTDGSYTEVGKLQTIAGDRMVYYNSNTDIYDQITHSAIISSYTDYPKSKRTFVVNSKWGAYGLYQHSWDNCPYYYINQFPCDLKYFH